MPDKGTATSQPRCRRPWWTGLALVALGCSGIAGGDAAQRAEDQISLDPIPHASPAFEGHKVGLVVLVNPALSRHDFLAGAAPDTMAEFLLEAGFRVVEGKAADLGPARESLEKNPTGLVDPATAAEIGPHLATDLVFVVSVTDYEQSRSKGGGGVSILGYGIDTGGDHVRYRIRIAGRLVDVRTREVLASKTASYERHFELGGGGIRTPRDRDVAGEDTEIAREAGGKVLQKCLNMLVVDIVTQVNTRG